MAQKRMFDKAITNSDDFIDMPDSAQNLYFHLSMNADDDGFINNWRNIMRMTGHKDDDMKILVSKQYIIPFDSGVIVIRHWRINNYLRGDRYTETKFKAERQQLQLDESMVYQVATNGIPAGIPSIDKISIDKNSIDKSSIVPPCEAKASADDITAKASKRKYGYYKHVLLKDEELQALKKDYANWDKLITYLDEYIEMKGYKAKNHYLCIKKWVVDAVARHSKETGRPARFADFLKEGENDQEGNNTDLGDNPNVISEILSEYTIE